MALKGTVPGCTVHRFPRHGTTKQTTIATEGTGREVGFGDRWLIAMLVREGTRVNAKRACTGGTARKVSDEDSATMPEAIVQIADRLIFQYFILASLPIARVC